eukprot:2498596-Rhodomonas_salina.2
MPPEASLVVIPWAVRIFKLELFRGVIKHNGLSVSMSDPNQPTQTQIVFCGSTLALRTHVPWARANTCHCHCHRRSLCQNSTLPNRYFFSSSPRDT